MNTQTSSANASKAQPTFSIRLAPALRTAVNALAEMEDRPASDIYRQAVRAEIRRSLDRFLAMGGEHAEKARSIQAALVAGANP